MQKGTGQRMTDFKPVNLTELEKARRRGKIGNAIGMTLFSLIILGGAGLLLWGLVIMITVQPVIGWTTIGGVTVIGLIGWSASVSDKAEKMEEDAKRYGIVDE